MTTARQKLISLHDRGAWEQALIDLPHAFAHTWQSCRAMTLTTGWRTYLYEWELGDSRAACAFAERGEDGRKDIVTPYGFGGFVGRDVPAEVLDDWRRFAEDRGYVAGFIGLNPVLAPSLCRRSPDYSEHNEVYLLELDAGRDVLHDRLSADRRRQIQRFAAGSARLTQDQEELSRFFLGEVDSFLLSKAASSTYAFTGATWDALLESESTFLLGVREEGSVTAACLFAHTPYCAEYLFGVSAPQGRAHSAALLWMGAVLLAQMGIPTLNLGGGIQKDDGVAEFKQRFGARREPLGALRQVYRADLYAAMCEAVGRDARDRTGYFPAFRAT